MCERPQRHLGVQKTWHTIKRKQSLEDILGFFGVQSDNDVVMIQGEWIIDFALQTKMKSCDR